MKWSNNNSNSNSNNNDDNDNTHQKVYSHIHTGHPPFLSQSFKCREILKYIKYVGWSEAKSQHFIGHPHHHYSRYCEL